MMQVPDPETILLWNIKLGTIVAGVIGGIIRAVLTPHRSWGDVARSCSGVIVGLIVAVIGTPIVGMMIDHWGYDYLPDSSIDAAVGSLLGMLGLTICEAALRWARIWRDREPPELGR